MGIKIDFNQGLDARLIDDGIAKRLARVKWLSPIRLACDTAGQMKAVQRAVTLLRWHNATPRRYFVYVLVKDLDDAIERVRFLKGLDLDCHAQPYIDFDGEVKISQKQKEFCRWVNRNWIFRKCTWEEYDSKVKTDRQRVNSTDLFTDFT